MDLSTIENIGKGKIKDDTNSRIISRDEMRQFTGTPEQLDTIFNNPFEGEQPKAQVYDARGAMKVMQENIAHGKVYGGKKMPSAIRESIIQNPLPMNESTTDGMTAFTNRLEQSLTGIQKSMGILERVENSEKERQAERLIEAKAEPTAPNSAGIDYSLIKMIVENAVEKKLSEMRGTLNENTERHSPELSVMKIGDKFLFLDNDDNVYECQMTYKGKNKKRTKK